MKRLIPILILLLLLIPSVSGTRIDHDPVASVDINEDILIRAYVSNDTEITKVDVHFRHFPDSGFVSLVLVEGTVYNGVWEGTIPGFNTSGLMTYTIKATRVDNIMKVSEDYTVQVGSVEEETSTFSLPEDPWVMAIGGGFLLVALVLMEILFRRRFFNRKKEPEKDETRKSARKIKKK